MRKELKYRTILTSFNLLVAAQTKMAFNLLQVTEKKKHAIIYNSLCVCVCAERANEFS